MLNTMMISLVIFLPAMGAIFQAVFALDDSKGAPLRFPFGRWVALVSSVASSIAAVMTIVLLSSHSTTAAVSRHPWLGNFTVSYEVWLDGWNALPALLVAFVFPILIIYEWKRGRGGRGVNGLLLLLQTSLLGALCTSDLFLVVFFWALSMLPIYFLTVIWGGSDREFAASRYMVVSAIGNAVLFLVLILIYFGVQPKTFSILDLTGGRWGGRTVDIAGLSFGLGDITFACLCLGFCCRIPVWPIHGWFTELMPQAPVTAQIALAGVQIPVGLAIFTKLVFALFPTEFARVAPWVTWVGVLNIFWGAVYLIAQRETARLLGMVCLLQTGVLLLGIGSINETSIVGGIYFVLMAGLGLSGLGLIEGFLGQRTGALEFCSADRKSLLGGLALQTPALAVLAALFVASLIGVPGLGGFVGQALVLMGGFTEHPWAVTVMVVALVLLTYGLFTFFRLVFLGDVAHVKTFKDLDVRERLCLVPLVTALIIFGLYPRPFLDLVYPAVSSILVQMK